MDKMAGSAQAGLGRRFAKGIPVPGRCDAHIMGCPSDQALIGMAALAQGPLPFGSQPQIQAIFPCIGDFRYRCRVMHIMAGHAGNLPVG